MLTPEPHHHDSHHISARSSIFDHDYPIPVAITLTTITYAATLALPFRFVWTVDNLLPLMQAHGLSANTYAQSQVSPSILAISILLIPALFFFILEFTVMRSYPPISQTAKVLFIMGITFSSILVGLISPLLSS